ncbi:metallophosphoesterase [Pontibacillus halophilus JSM 076056 = DSM 19796]|uniref:Metallophosphoesterase n=1 Tax=Pontibacillus halophilus JSM 076056 = DSM 19796 TaxID=1385510 RepID=A0A0A5GNI9_9BACI|nr:bifunctional UDP-sugar hydrolase/5'-nucleotidase [Pontibacillus halophilus]KGX92818.1 metallophosphoesterase [Pontibacillus halophilus JSM 076056 = DSM 19796]
MKENIYLYYTNDLHSHFENWPSIIGHWKEQQLHHQRRDETMLLLDVGDHVDRFHPISEAMMGKANVELLNEAGYDLVTIGNNEGITLSYQDLYHLYDEATFDVIVGNLHSEEQEPAWLKSYTIKETKAGTRIGVIGLTAPFQAFYRQLGWDVSSPYEQLEKLVPIVEEKADIVVLLSHLGINDDEEIARRFPQIEVIIGGHTHHLFKQGEWVNDTLLTAAGKHGHYVGQVHLQYDAEDKRLTSKAASAYSIATFMKDEETEATLQQYSNKAFSYLDQSIAHVKEPLSVNWFQETLLIRELVETVRMWTGAPVAMLNAGVLLDSLEQGHVTRGDVHRICPHPINPCTVKLTGDELTEVVRESLTKRFTELKLKGFGFRGEVIGKMIYSGLDVFTRKDAEGHEHLERIELDGEPIDRHRTYTIATADMFTFGRLLPEIAQSREKEYYMPEFLRDLLTETLQRVERI